MYISGGGAYRPARLKAWQDKIKRDARRRMDRFAELLADGYTVTGASRELGITQQAGSLILKKIRQGLGEDQCR
jgi:hypothetical protein